jgi:RimJ/RimL family protein N-acetyltransferase
VIAGDRLPTLNAERVALRWLTEADVPDLFAVFGDPAVMRYWSSPPLVDDAAARELLAEIHELFAKGTLHQWGVGLIDSGEIIGTCTLTSWQAESRRAELGFALGRKHWGHGYMSEALTALLNYAFGELDLNRLEADVDPRNRGSRRLLERLGFVPEGLLRERWILAGEVQDSKLYGLLARQWKALRARD